MRARGRGRVAAVAVAMLAGALAWTAGTAAPAGGQTAPAPAASAGCEAATPVAPGNSTRTLTSGTVERTYIRHVPPAHDGTTPVPLVVAAHGFVEGAVLHEITSQYSALADAEGFAVVYPQGLGSPASWSVGIGSSDVTFIGDLLDEVESTLCVDRDRIYMSGYSMGAFLTSSVVCTFADRIAAVAPVAGLRVPSGCAPSRPVPAITFHGTADTWVSFNAIPGNVAAWAGRNGCATPATETLVASDEVVDVTLVRHPCEPAASVELYRIDGGGHGWPGSQFSRDIEAAVGYTTMEISASELIWDFFAAHPMPREEPPPPPGGSFLALTYNVAGLPEPLSGSEPAVNTPFISPLLNAYDLVLVQEDWANEPPLPGGLSVYHELLVADVDHPYLSTPAPLPLGTNPLRPTAFVSDGLNRMSRFPFGDVTRVMWPNCFGGPDTSDGGAADCLAEKGFSVARTELAPGVEVDVYNLHAEAGGTAADQAARAEDYAVLAAFIQEHSAGNAVIVGGDFNLHTDRPVDGAVHRLFLHEAGLTDVCEAVDCGADDHRIDKFAFRSGGGIVLEARSHRFERDVFVRPTDGAPLSDHPALAVEFAWSVDAEAPGSIRGTVTGDAAPAAGVVVQAFGPGDTWVGTAAAVTGSDGRYEITGLPAGTYQVAFSPPSGSALRPEWSGDAPGRAAAADVDVTAAGVAPGVDAELGRATGVTGTVTASGGPVAGTVVWAYLPTDKWIGSAATVTGLDGSYHLDGLPAGTYALRFVPPADSGLAPEWFEDAAVRAAAAPVTVALGAPAVVDATL